MPSLRSMDLPKAFKGTGYIRVKIIAEYLGVTLSAVYKWINEGTLRGEKIGKVVLVKRKDFRDFVDIKFKAA